MKKLVKIGDRLVGEGQPCFIIAEAGLNHNGDPELAKELIKIACQSGADAIKFQKRTIGDILIKEVLDAPYLRSTALAPTYGEHRYKLELADEIWHELNNLARQHGIVFSASAWDHKSADFLESIDVPFFKTPSADIINLPLLEYIAKKKKPMIVSTGMCTLEEIDEAVEVIQRHNDQFILLHCISNYPCTDSEVNLKIIETLKKRYGVPVGYSSHDKGVAIPASAVSLGACVIEKHFTLDRTMLGPDHAASLEPQGLAKMIKYIRHTEMALGSGEKFLNEAEREPRKRLAKSVVAKVDIPKGTVITADMLMVKGPGSGLKPKYISELYGKIAQEDVLEDTLIPLDSVNWPNNF
ncbi:N-acetylneuraminate synthase family protein [Patescibacteria group bacterium]|nr:N-acetylneuraminate synthase family protein [Patescibacteria group bacterium]